MEKNEAKVSLSTFLLIFAIVIIAIMGYYIYRIGQDRNIQAQKVTELEKTISTINSKTEEIQNIVNGTTKTTETASYAGKKVELGSIELTIPQKMEEYGNYKISTSSNNYSKEIYIIEDKLGADILRIAVVDANYEEKNTMWDNVEVVVKNGTNKVIVGGPTDVQWTEADKEIYTYLGQFRQQIIDSIKFKDDTSKIEEIAKLYVKAVNEKDWSTVENYSSKQIVNDLKKYNISNLTIDYTTLKKNSSNEYYYIDSYKFDYNGLKAQDLSLGNFFVIRIDNGKYSVTTPYGTGL